MNKFKAGDRVRIKGDNLDFTAHLDGKEGTVLRPCSDVEPGDYYVDMGQNGKHDTWRIWVYNMTPVEEDS